MKVRTILYHDVVDGDPDASGFPGAAAARYKLTQAAFARQLAAMAPLIQSPTTFTTLHGVGAGATVETPFLITFDDGGSSFMHIADALEGHGWRGNFFITTDRIGTTGFLGRNDVAELARRGHGIGSHSASHPYRISALPADALVEEWRRSVDCLSEILGRAVRDASVPGGYYAPRCAEAAATVGVRWLYTSEPTAMVGRVGDCRVLGRYCVYRGMSDRHAAALAAGNLWPAAQQKALWTAKGAVKRLAAPIWDMARSRVFARG
jgi:hypothetical protein